MHLFNLFMPPIVSFLMEPTKTLAPIERVKEASSSRLHRPTTSEIYRLHGPFVWSTLQRFGVKVHDLDDLMQEVFMVVHRKLDTFDPSLCKVTTWLYSIAHHVASSFLKKAYHSREVLKEDAGLDLVCADSFLPDLPLELHELEELLGRCLDAMPLDKRAIFVMAEIDEIPINDIATMLDIPVGTAHSRLHYARIFFQQTLTRELSIESSPSTPTSHPLMNGKKSSQ